MHFYIFIGYFLYLRHYTGNSLLIPYLIYLYWYKSINMNLTILQ